MGHSSLVAGHLLSLSQSLDETAAWLRDRAGAAPAMAVILGSGWDAFAGAVDTAAEFACADVPHLSTPQVHAGMLHIGTVGGRRVACLRGRCHGYEGYSPNEVVYAARALARWGVGTVLLTNAAGGIRDGLDPGDFMLIGDHVNLTATNPLLGLGSVLGPRFVDMTEAYDAELRARVNAAAAAAGVPLKSGVYASTLGPMYETPAEIRAMASQGIDAIGMSTVWETIALRQMGVRVVGISCITNKAAGLAAGAKLSHEDIVHTARRVEQQCVALLTAAVGAILE